MASVIESISIAELAILLYLVTPAVAWVFSVAMAELTWRSLTAHPLRTPPSVHAGLVRRLYAMVALDSVFFGFVLWILTRPIADALQSGGGSAPLDAGFQLFLSVGVVYSATAFVVAATQARVFSRRIQELIGGSSARAQAFLAIPVLATMFALIAGFLTLRFAESFLTPPGSSAPQSVGSWMVAWVALGISVVAFPVASELALRQDVGTRLGFVRAARVVLAGSIPSLVILGWFLFLASAS